MQSQFSIPQKIKHVSTE